MSGRLVILNGAPRAGKSTIARALMASGPWINFGVDAQMQVLPDALKPGVGLRPGGERPDLEAHVRPLYAALFDAAAGYCRHGFDVVSDVGLHDDYSRPLGVLSDTVRRLSALPVLFVGVRCPVEVIMARRNADPRGGLYAGGDTVPAPVARWQEAVHAHGVYDLEVDTSRTTAAEAAAVVLGALEQPPVPSAFQRLATSLTDP